MVKTEGDTVARSYGSGFESISGAVVETSQWFVALLRHCLSEIATYLGFIDHTVSSSLQSADS